MPGIPVFLVSEKLVFRQILAEKEGFEPSCRLPDKRISSAPRYDLFDTSPYPLVCRARKRSLRGALFNYRECIRDKSRKIRCLFDYKQMQICLFRLYIIHF